MPRQQRSGTEIPPSSGATRLSSSDELYNYGFNDVEGFPDTKDLGLLILDEPVILDEYAALAAAGTLDQLATRRGKKDVRFTVSGYGLTDPREHPPSRFLSFRERLMAQAKLVNLRSALTGGFNLQTSANPGKGRGGTCFGDSGGPIFYPAESNTIVAVTSFGLSPWCTGVDYSYRTDTEAALAWILTTAPASERDDIQIVSLGVQAEKKSAKRNDKDGKSKGGKHQRKR